ncbi:hypothetical protein EUX98_g6746 [Antrodiella citrinella]|uniref:Phosphodiesterase n=1 Tax=Antrodiella citrinella TaxID=2447956 RepID=A0A4S4MNE0_9APHY|nr:hypothetical protein EUX98_g6746 [Antrodiella citrinella]
MSVPRRRRGKSVDTGGLALALSDQSQGLGHGWGGWEETETGETRYAEVLIDVRAHTEEIVNPSYESVPSPSVSTFQPTVPTSPNPLSPQHFAAFSSQVHDIHHDNLSSVGDKSAPPEDLTGNDDPSRPRYISYPQPFHLLMQESNRRRLIESLSCWNFEPHKLSSDEVLSCALLLFEGFLHGVPGGAVGGVELGQLPAFLHNLQTIYRQKNSYHNFEHALDVFQALYHFLSEVGIVQNVRFLLKESNGIAHAVSDSDARTPSILDVLTKEDILALFIAAVGHDVGHPGLTNGFMKNAQTPLSVLYDDKSVLEQMHYALILKVMKHTGLGGLLDGSADPRGHSSTLGCKKLLLSTVLVTDLSVHDRFMLEFAEMIDHGDFLTDPFKAKVLACQALIKCADISNPARPYTVSQHWAAALSSEWSSQVVLEKHLDLPPSVYPSVDALGEAKGQVFFIERFAGPLFNLIGRGIPQLEKFSEQCHDNLTMWKERLERFSVSPQDASPQSSSTAEESLLPTPNKPLKFISSRAVSPEEFLTAFAPTLPKSFVSPSAASSSFSDTDEEASAASSAFRIQTLRTSQNIDEIPDTVDTAISLDEDDVASLSGSSEYETCESSPGSPALHIDRVGPPKLEITTSTAPHKHSHSRSGSHVHKRRVPSVSSPSYLLSPSETQHRHHHRAPSMASDNSVATNTTSASISANATAAIRAAYKASVRKKPSARSFNRSSWNPPPTEYKTFVTTPASPTLAATPPSPSLPPVVFTNPGFDTSMQARDPSTSLTAARFGSAEALSPLTPESGTTASSTVSPLTPESTSSTEPPDPPPSGHTFGMTPVYHRVL